VDARRYAPATARNREPIAAVLREELPSSGLVLEVASGTGEHAAYFAGLFPGLDWQPSDPNPASLESIAAWREEAGLPNLRAPVQLDASASDWPVTAADSVLCINMVHISPWEATLGLLAGAARLLPPGGLLILYGPYFRDAVETAPSNLAFDMDLQARNPQWGLRHLEEVDREAIKVGLEPSRLVEMPANNIMRVYRRL
jgi:SAM-dependent methyltransferase